MITLVVQHNRKLNRRCRKMQALERGEELAAAFLNHLRFVNAYVFLKRQYVGSQVAITAYHRVTVRKDEWSLRDQISARNFEEQIQYLRKNFEIISFDELVQHLLQGKSLPKKAMVITFDDGYKDNYLYAFAILKKYALPATFFLATGHIGTGKLFWWDRVGYLIYNTAARRVRLDGLGTYGLESASDRHRTILSIIDKLKHFPETRKSELIERLATICQVNIPVDLAGQLLLSWDDVKKMHRGGACIGAHSVTHPILTNLPLDQAELEIMQSKKDIERNLGEQINYFAYPDGSYNNELVRLVKQSGFTGAVAAVATERSWITPRSEIYSLNRIGMTEGRNKSAVLLSGISGDLGMLRRKAHAPESNI